MHIGYSVYAHKQIQRQGCMSQDKITEEYRFLLLGGGGGGGEPYYAFDG